MFGVVLLLFIPVDLLLTLQAVAKYGIGGELNPIMRALLQRGLAILLVVHLLVGVASVQLFLSILSLVERLSKPYDRYFERTLQVWLGVLLATALLVVANNFAVVLIGRTIIVLL